MKKSLVILGAGKVGRGFLADLFHQEGYEILFIDSDKKMVDRFREAGSYSVLSMPPEGEQTISQIKGYRIYHTSEKENIRGILDDADLMAVATFPQAFGSVSGILAETIERRATTNNSLPLDILLCTNIHNPSLRMKDLLIERLSDRGQACLEKSVGLVETLIMRISIEPDDSQKSVDPLIVVTNGFAELPLDETAFKGELPQVKGLAYTDRIRAEEVRKMYTYNLVHAVFAYAGSRKKYRYTTESCTDPGILRLAENVILEVSEGLMGAYGFSQQEMTDWNRKMFANMTNPALRDPILRIAADPVRKLKRTDRLTGPALMCRGNGILPYYLAEVIASALLFDNPEDPGSREIREYIRKHGVSRAITRYCELEKERDLVWLIKRHYDQIKSNRSPENYTDRIGVMKKAFHLGFKYEKQYRGCAQCSLAALYELTGKRENMLFQAASAFSGGMALSGDGSCGGYSGGILFMGTYTGRRWDKIDGDKDAQYDAYDLAMKLRERFIETYGSVVCKEIHEKIFGRSYILQTKNMRDEFEEAGAHRDKCTVVIGMSAMWVAEILMDENFI